jgi:DNA-directed RNA polymerase specialized sigma subunit, sigma24 homolog
MSLYEKVIQAKKDQDVMVNLLVLFSPLIKKYAFLLGVEDGQAELTAAFIKTIQDYPYSFNKKEDMYTLSYLKKAVRNEYIALSKKHSRIQTVYIDDNPLDEPADYDNSDLIFLDLVSCLTPLQQKIILEKYYYCNTDAEIASNLQITRQSVNRAKNRALSILKKALVSN